jgi:hypothetical protein
VDDEVLAARPALVGVALAGEDERLLDELAVYLLGRVAGVLLDHREEVAEQGALLRGQLLRDRVGTRRARAAGRLADTGMPSTVPVELLYGALGPVYAGCALL